MNGVGGAVVVGTSTASKKRIMLVSDKVRTEMELNKQRQQQMLDDKKRKKRIYQQQREYIQKCESTFFFKCYTPVRHQLKLYKKNGIYVYVCVFNN